MGGGEGSGRIPPGPLSRGRGGGCCGCGTCAVCAVDDGVLQHWGLQHAHSELPAARREKHRPGNLEVPHLSRLSHTDRKGPWLYRRRVENPDAGGCWLYSERVQVELGEE